jgi:hypothetical protein
VVDKESIMPHYNLLNVTCLRDLALNDEKDTACDY